MIHVRFAKGQSTVRYEGRILVLKAIRTTKSAGAFLSRVWVSCNTAHSLSGDSFSSGDSVPSVESRSIAQSSVLEMSEVMIADAQLLIQCMRRQDCSNVPQHWRLHNNGQLNGFTNVWWSETALSDMRRTKTLLRQLTIVSTL